MHLPLILKSFFKLTWTDEKHFFSLKLIDKTLLKIFLKLFLMTLLSKNGLQIWAMVLLHYKITVVVLFLEEN